MFSEATLYKTLLDTKGAPFFPTIADRAPWEARVQHPVAQQALNEAARLTGQPIPDLPASLFQQFQRNGNRMRFEHPYFNRRTYLWYFTAAECLLNDGRYLDDIINYIWALCEESTWVLPAHLGGLALPDVQDPSIDLFASGSGFTLAEADYLLGDKLPPAVRKRIRRECAVRLTEPYLRRTDFGWYTNVNNWNAVCNAGLVAVALYLETDPMVQARVINKAMSCQPVYLSGFDADGCTSEGVGYWAYGFGLYTMMSHMIETRTEGKVNLLDSETWGANFKGICQFPVDLELAPTKFVNFSDADEDEILPSGVCCYLGRKLGIPTLDDAGRRYLHLGQYGWHIRPHCSLRDLFWAEPDLSGATPKAPTAWYEGYQWLISRHEAAHLVLAAKGGHNEEMHNHNDVGQFNVVYNGESVILDLGRQHYTKDFFGPKRFTFLECGSHGHNVPVVNGQVQPFGRTYEAKVLSTAFTAEADALELDLTGAYPAAAALDALHRRISLSRAGSGEIAVADTYRFVKGMAGEFESRLHTLGTVEQVAPGQLKVTGKKGALHVYYDPAAVAVKVEELEPHENSKWSLLRRMSFIQRAAEGRVALRIVPA